MNIEIAVKTISLNKDTELRQLSLSDIEDIFHALDSQREYLGVWLPFVEQTRSVNDTRVFVETIVHAPCPEESYTFTIQYKGRFAGLIGFNYTDRANRRTEIGYWLREEFQGKGIMTRAVKALCVLAFEELDINRVQIRCAVGNQRSKNVPLRLGFTYEGTERDGEQLAGGRFADTAVYSKLLEDYRAESRGGAPELNYRSRRAVPADIETLKKLYFETIASTNNKDYTAEEIEDWISCGEPDEKWEKLITELYFIVAEERHGKAIGYAAIALDGYLHSLFVHKDFLQQGVASFLLDKIEQYAIRGGFLVVTSDVSLTAKPFFLRKGFYVCEVQNRKANRLYLKSYKMIKELS